METSKGLKRTLVKMKVRPEAKEKLLADPRMAGIDPAAARVGEPLPEDLFANDIFTAVKTVNHHAQDHKDNQSTLKRAADHPKALRWLRALDHLDVREMTQTYIGWIEEVQQAAREKRPIHERFEIYLGNSGGATSS